MSVNFSAKTKGYIKNLETGAMKEFQFNPEKFSYSRGADYSEVIAPGMSYPLTQFVKGKIRTFPLELFHYDKPSTGLILDVMKFYGALLTPETNTKDYKRPPMFLFVYGVFIRKCVLDDLNVNVEEYDTEGNMAMARFTLTIRQVSP